MPITHLKGVLLRIPRGVEVVVDRDAADPEGIGNFFDGATHHKGTSIVEHLDGTLFVFTAEVLKISAEFVFHLIDEPVQRTRKLWKVKRRQVHTLPNEGNVSCLRLVAGHDFGTKRFRNGLKGDKEGVVHCLTTLVHERKPITGWELHGFDCRVESQIESPA